MKILAAILVYLLLVTATAGGVIYFPAGPSVPVYMAPSVPMYYAPAGAIVVRTARPWEVRRAERRGEWMYLLPNEPGGAVIRYRWVP